MEEWIHGIERPSRMPTPASEADDLSTLVESTINVRPLKRALALTNPMDPVSESEDTRIFFEHQLLPSVRERMGPGPPTDGPGTSEPKLEPGNHSPSYQRPHPRF
jgi:hypothetical protein